MVYANHLNLVCCDSILYVFDEQFSKLSYKKTEMLTESEKETETTTE